MDPIGVLCVISRTPSTTQIQYSCTIATGRRVCHTLTMEQMTTGERYQIRAKISMLFRQANLVEDRQTDDGRIRAMALRQEANDLNESLKGRKYMRIRHRAKWHTTSNISSNAVAITTARSLGCTGANATKPSTTPGARTADPYPTVRISKADLTKALDDIRFSLLSTGKS